MKGEKKNAERNTTFLIVIGLRKCLERSCFMSVRTCPKSQILFGIMDLTAE